MTDNQQDAVVGRAIREERENSVLIAKLQSQFRHLAKEHGRLQKALNNNPESIAFSGEDVNPQLHAFFDYEMFDPKQLQTLLEEYKNAIMEQRELDLELKRLGVRPEPITITRP